MARHPKSVTKQANLANKLHAQAYETPTDPQDELIGDLTDVANNKKQSTVEVSEQNVLELSNTDTQPLTPEASSEENPAESKTQTPEKGIEPQPPADTGWEHKYNVINGKYKAEVPRLHQQVRELTTEVEAMRSVIANIAKPDKKQESYTNQVSSVTEDEIKEFGPDLISVIGKASRDVVSPEVALLKEQIALLQTSFAGINEKSTQNIKDRLLSDLTASVPSWEEQNSDPLFMDWLSMQDPFSGMQRLQMLDEAFEKNDTARVINFFKAYLTENGLVQQSIAEEVAPRTPQVDLAEHAAPGKTRASAPAPQGNKQIWTQSKVSEFYRAVNKGVYKNKDAEKRTIEKDIVAAAQEGRLVA